MENMLLAFLSVILSWALCFFSFFVPFSPSIYHLALSGRGAFVSWHLFSLTESVCIHPILNLHTYSAYFPVIKINFAAKASAEQMTQRFGLRQKHRAWKIDKVNNIVSCHSNKRNVTTTDPVWGDMISRMFFSNRSSQATTRPFHSWHWLFFGKWFIKFTWLSPFCIRRVFLVRLMLECVESREQMNK